MKTMLVIFASALMALTSQVSAGELVVVVKGIKLIEGTLLIGIFDSKETFKKDVVPGSTKDPITKELIAADGSMTVTIKDLKPGTYAFIAFQDLNGNNEVELGAWGVPTEPMAFSNMPKIMFGPPSFKACSFEVPEVGSVTKEITLRSKEDPTPKD